MKIKAIISAIEETLSHLRNSESSTYSHTSVEGIIEKLEIEISKARNSQPIDTEELRLLFAPTGAIQETSMHNGWAEKALEISKIIDEFTSDS